MFLERKKKALCLGKNIEYLLKLHNIDVKNLSIQTGIPAATIARMKVKGSNPTVSTIEPLLDFFRIDMDTLLYKDISNPEYQAKKKTGDLVYITVVQLKNAQNVKSSKIIKFIGAAGITNKHVFGVSITTNTLAPAFQNNSIVVIDPDLAPKESDYLLCCLGDDLNPVFRQIFMDGSQYFFKPINPGFGEMRFYETFTIIGIAIKSIGSYR